MRKILPLLIAVLFVAACNKGTTITYKVINNTGEQLTIVSYYSHYTQGKQSTVINNGDTRDIMILSTADDKFEEGYTAGTGIDSVTGSTNTGKILTKNLALQNSWNRSSNKKQGLHNFTTVLSANDIQ